MLPRKTSSMQMPSTIHDFCEYRDRSRIVTVKTRRLAPSRRGFHDWTSPGVLRWMI